MDNSMGTDNNLPPSNGYKDYILSGKIMMSAMIILFLVIVVVICLHLYARYYLLRARRSHRRSRRRHSNLVFFVDSANAGHTLPVPARGLDAAVLNSLPIFVYSSKTHPDPIECPVCLSEFEDSETGRILPKCNHSFHIDCIDMWFHSHSTCPLCRSPVEPGALRENPDNQVVVTVGEPERNDPGSSYGLCSECVHEDYEMDRVVSSSSSGSSSVGSRRKPLERVGVSIEVPRRNRSFGRVEDQLGCDSPASQGYKSQMSRMMSLSFKRILSRDRRGGVSPSGNSVSYSSVTESDVERGRDVTQ